MKGVNRDGHDGDESRTYLRNTSNNKIFYFELEANGDFRVNFNTKTSWNLNTVYKMRAYNINFENKVFY